MATAPQQVKSNFVVTAQHQAYGSVRFAIPAEDARAAFVIWKQIVGRPNQWIVKSNVQEGYDDL